MTLIRRLLAVSAAVTCSLVASGCDTSPVAASVGGASIKQTVLDAQLKAVSSNKAFVAAFDANQANQSGGVRIVGDASGTYGSGFVAETLTGIIQDTVERQYLGAHHRLPGPGLLAAVSGFEAGSYRTLWPEFPVSYRNYLVGRIADLSEFVPVSTNAAELRALYRQGSSYLYTQVCVRQIAVSVNDASGGVDYAASRAQADRLAQDNSLHNEVPGLTGGPSIGGGVVTCYSPEELQAQPPAFYERILTLGVNRAAAPVRTSFGYRIDIVTTRTSLLFGPDFERAASLVLASAQGNGLSLPFLSQLLAATKVHVDPQYGRWVPRQGAVVAPTTLGANGTQSNAAP